MTRLLVVTLVGCLWLLLATHALAQTQQTYYVAPPPTGSDTNPGTQAQPFATLPRAQQAVRGINSNMTGNIIVQLAGGRYQLGSTLQLTPLDSGTNNFRVIWQAAPGQIPQLSGGKFVTGWTATTGGVFKASLAGTPIARQLYINGVRGQRARLPNTWPAAGTAYRTRQADQGNNRFSVTTTELQGNIAPLSTGQVEVFIDGAHGMIGHIASTSSAGGGNTWLNFRDNMEYSNNWDYVDGRPYYLSNHLSYLDAEGEFYMDATAGEVHYKPRAGETLATAQVIIPVLSELIHLQGSEGNPVRNITFDGLRFEHTTYMAFNANGCAVCGKVGMALVNNGGGEAFGGAIDMTFTDGIIFQNNVYRHLGGMAGTMRAVKNMTARGNVYWDIGLGGYYFVETETGNTNTALQCANPIIDNNYFVRTGQDLPGTTPIELYSVDGSTITHNEMFDHPSGGISYTGWDDAVPRRNANVSFNKIGPGCQIQYDFAAVYVWGNWAPNSHVTQNWLYGHQSFWGDCGGWYCDGGYEPVRCENWLVDNNVFENDDFTTYLNDAVGNTVVNVPEPTWDNSPGENTYVNNGSLNIAAVKANAGLQSAYLGIKNRVNEDVGPGTPVAQGPRRHAVQLR